MLDDPRDAKTLGEAALNPDGKTWNGARALSWLSKALDPAGKGMSVEEVLGDIKKAQAIVKAKRAQATAMIDEAEKAKESEETGERNRTAQG